MANSTVSALTAASALDGTELYYGVQGGADRKVTGAQIKTLTSASPTLVTPTLGVATATSINKVALTAPATGSTLTIADGKTLTASNSLTLTGTDSTSFAFPSTSGTVATLGIAQSFTASQTFNAATSSLYLGANGGNLGVATLYGSTSGSVTLKAAAAAGTGTVFQLPADNGTNAYVLQTNGSGITSWVAQSGGGGSPGGSDTQIQFNDSSAFGGDADFTWNKTTNTLYLGGTYLLSEAANTLALRNSTNAQSLRVYGTYTDASNYTRVSLGNVGGVLTLLANGAGTGGAPDFYLDTRRLFIDINGNRAWAVSAARTLYPAYTQSTTMTDGFLNISGAAGAVTGVPTTTTGFPIYYDSTNNKIYVYNGSWRSTAALT